MRIFNAILTLVFVGLLGFLIYANTAYFMEPVSFDLSFKHYFSYTVPPVPNVACFGICLLIGLLLAWLHGLAGKFDLKRRIRELDSRMDALTSANQDLQTELDVFTHDPYIKQGLADKAAAESVIALGAPEPEPDPEASADAEPETSKTIDETDAAPDADLPENAGTDEPEMTSEESEKAEDAEKDPDKAGDTDPREED